MPPRKKKPTRRKSLAPPRAKPKPVARAKPASRAVARAKPKPAARAKPKPPARRASSRSKPEPAARRATKGRSAPRKPALRARARELDESLERPSLISMAEPEPDPSPRAQPVGVGAARAMWETSDEPLTEPIPREAIAVPADTSPHVDRPVAELAVGLFALLLALSVFLPWYHNVVGTVSGWSSGTWGPIVFFAALTALAIVGLRRAGIAIDFPVEPTLVIEIIGWVCVVALILKRYRVPQVAGIKLPTDGWIFASLVCALGLAVTAGWASSNAPFVVRKAWFRDPAGRLGTAVIAVALAGGLGFGFANAVSAPTSSAGTPTVIPQLVRGVPKCAGKLHIPTPQGYTATQGYDFKNQPTNCVVYYTTSLKLDTALSRMVSTLRASGWTVTQGRPTPISRTLAISGRGCGAVQLITQAGRPTTVYLNVLPCPKPSK